MNFVSFRSFDFLSREQLSTKKLLFIITLVYLFGIFVRLILVYQAGQIGPLWADGEPIAIWTPDAGRYGYYAKEILAGVSLPFSDDYLLGYLIAFVSSVTSISVDWVMILLPILIAPLIAIPIVMIGTTLGNAVLGLLSAAIAVTGSHFYLRSHIGYVDTDGVNHFLVLMAIAFVIKGFAERRLVWFGLASIMLILFGWWYHSATSVELLIVMVAFVYLVLFERRESLYLGGFMLLLVPLVPIALILKFVALSALFVFLFLAGRAQGGNSYRLYWGILGIGIIAGLFAVHPDHFIARASAYMSEAQYIPFGEKGEYSYLNDMQFVNEAGKVNLWNIFATLFVAKLYVWLGTLGYVLLVLRYPLALLLAPLLLLGYLSGLAGGRFSMYATAVLAFGFVTLLYFLRAILVRRFGEIRYALRLPYYGTTLAVVLMIYNIFVYNSSVAMGLIFYGGEKSMLDSFSKKLSDKDTIINWWDYGWPLWYYTGYNNTLTDNGYHGGPDSHLVAQILLSDEPYFVANASRYLARHRPPSRTDSAEFTLPLLAKEHNLTTLIDSWHAQKQIELQGEEGNTYIILHQNMLSIYGVLQQYAFWDMTQKGVYSVMPKYVSTPIVKPFSRNHSLLEGYSYIFDSSDGKVMDAEGNKTAVNMLMIASGNNTRQESYSYHNSSNITLLNAKGLLLWLDDASYNSFFIQAMLLDVYDKNLFEKVAETPRVKIFRVKRPGE